MTWLAGLYDAKEQLDLALPLHEEVLRGFAIASHPMTQRCAGHVVALLRQLGREAEADAIAAEHGVVAAAAAPEAAPPLAGSPSSAPILLA